LLIDLLVLALLELTLRFDLVLTIFQGRRGLQSDLLFLCVAFPSSNDSSFPTVLESMPRLLCLTLPADLLVIRFRRDLLCICAFFLELDPPPLQLTISSISSLACRTPPTRRRRSVEVSASRTLSRQHPPRLSQAGGDPREIFFLIMCLKIPPLSPDPSPIPVEEKWDCRMVHYRLRTSFRMAFSPPAHSAILSFPLAPSAPSPGLFRLAPEELSFPSFVFVAVTPFLPAFSLPSLVGAE